MLRIRQQLRRTGLLVIVKVDLRTVLLMESVKLKVKMLSMSAKSQETTMER